MDHWLAFSREMRTVIAHDSLLFMQPPVLAVPPLLKERGLIDRYMVYTPHYYDGLTLMLKHWNPKFNVDAIGVIRGRYRSPPVMAVRLGEANIRNCLAAQLIEMKREGQFALGADIPCLFSEIGIPYDMDDKIAYENGDFLVRQELSMLIRLPSRIQNCHTLYGATAGLIITSLEMVGMVRIYPYGQTMKFWHKFQGNQRP